jgi:hypothetical protein
MDANQQCQSIFHMARKVDGLGERTLGVLTKCDRVPREESDELEAVSYSTWLLKCLFNSERCSK